MGRDARKSNRQLRPLVERNTYRKLRKIFGCYYSLTRRIVSNWTNQVIERRSGIAMELHAKFYEKDIPFCYHGINAKEITRFARDPEIQEYLKEVTV